MLRKFAPNGSLFKYLHRFGSQMASSKTIKVQVKQGVLVGKQSLLPNRSGVFNSFQGVPYAVPPLGKLRFKSPIPLERFDVPELDCTRERSVCQHRDPMTSQVVGSENCLFLNVYAPQSAKKQRPSPMPVMVWIHGGGFLFGSSSSDYYYPMSLMEEDVIVVTLNYRLGALGFLCLPEEGVWGNAGLKDQRLALQWVQENISKFGGDPANVTLFGESAGAAAVHMHAYSGHANKLFHKAIMQSGTANMEWVFQANPAYKAHRLAELLGYTDDVSNIGNGEMLRFLQSDQVTPLQLIANQTRVLTADERRRGLPMPFRLVIEDAASPDRFISAPISETLQCENALAIPTIIGYNSAEGISMTVNAIKKLTQIDKDLERFIPRNLPLTDESALQALAQRMRDFYLGGRTLTNELLDDFTDLLTDYHFTVDLQQAVEMQVRYQPQAPLYFYRFEYVGGRNIHKRFLQLEHLRGACHGDEMFYQFQSYGGADSVNDECLSDSDALMVRRLARLWANFARNGKPTPDAGKELPVIDCAWEPVARPASKTAAFVLDYLAIDRECQMRRNPDQKRVDFWRDVYSSQKSPPIDYSRLSAKL